MTRRHIEASLQISVIQWLCLIKMSERCAVWHTANGGKRSKSEGTRLKAMGVVAGVPDLIFVWSRDFTTRVGAIELKVGKGTLSASQIAWRNAGPKHGIAWAECRSIEAVADVLTSWGLVTLLERERLGGLA